MNSGDRGGSLRDDLTALIILKEGDVSMLIDNALIITSETIIIGHGDLLFNSTIKSSADPVIEIPADVAQKGDYLIALNHLWLVEPQK